MPQPAPQMSELTGLIGTFDCKGEVKPPHAEPHPIERTFTGELDLDGFWLFIRFDDTVTAQHPHPLRGNWQMTYDISKKSFVALWTDNIGRWCVQTSAGWDGAAIAFAGEFVFDGKPGAVRDTFIIVSANELKMLVDIQDAGTWMRSMDVTCRKRGSA